MSPATTIHSRTSASGWKGSSKPAAICAYPAADAVSVAVCHVTFNVLAALVWYPLRAIPIGVAAWYAQIAAGSKKYYFLFLGVVYFMVPLVVYLITTIFLGTP